MRLQVLLPDRRLIDAQVQKIFAESGMGFFTLLPRHIDLVTTIEPGLLTYTTMDEQEIHLAVDHGILVKRAADVLVSVNRAMCGEDLRTLQQVVRDEFHELDERERKARSALADLQADMVRYFIELGE